MKLTRRNFLKSLGVGIAGAVLAWVPKHGEAVADAEPSSDVGEWTPDTLLPYEPLKPYIWNPYTANITTEIGSAMPIFSDIGREIATGYVDTEFDSAHDLGLGVGHHTPASLTMEQDGQLFLYALGDVRLCGLTAGCEEVIYHYHFGGYETETGYL